ncbi:MAG: hypothetical protein ACLTLQ_08905 [[Clostridium] scindens]
MNFKNGTHNRQRQDQRAFRRCRNRTCAWAERSATRCPGVPYVYQAMRVTGAAKIPTVSVNDTMKRQVRPEELVIRGQHTDTVACKSDRILPQER